MSHRIKTPKGNRLFSLAILDDADPGEVEDLIVTLEATSGGVTTDGLREAAVAVCMLWFTDNAPDGSPHIRKAMLDLRDALDVLSTTPPAPADFYIDTITDQNGDELERGEPDPTPEVSIQPPRSTV